MSRNGRRGLRRRLEGFGDAGGVALGCRAGLLLAITAVCCGSQFSVLDTDFYNSIDLNFRFVRSG